MSSPLKDAAKYTGGQWAALVRKLGGPRNVDLIHANPVVARQVAELITSLAKVLRVAQVNYDDPTHRENYEQFDYVDGRFTFQDLCVRGKGKARVWYEYVWFAQSLTAGGIVKAIHDCPYRRLPDFAEAREFFSQVGQKENDFLCVSPFGFSEYKGILMVSSAIVTGSHMTLHLNPTDELQETAVCFLAVRTDM